jgi:diadenosine tetraphosphate (Ap4A) HIT family hydrolase
MLSEHGGGPVTAYLGDGDRAFLPPAPVRQNARMAATDDEAGCVFCEIVAGRRPASVVHSDENVIAFLDIRPLNTGHLLVIPRAHAAYLADLDPALGGHMFAVAQRMAAALRRSGLPCEGVNLFLADGEAAFQEVFHVHLHVIPRNSGDGFRLRAKWRSPSRAELESVAGQVRDGLTRP